jgi:hypothetical protein
MSEARTGRDVHRFVECPHLLRTTDALEGQQATISGWTTTSNCRGVSAAGHLGMTRRHCRECWDDRTRYASVYREMQSTGAWQLVGGAGSFRTPISPSTR